MTGKATLTIAMMTGLVLASQARTTVGHNDAGDLVLANGNASLVFSGGKDFLFKEFKPASRIRFDSTSLAAHLPWSRRRESVAHAALGCLPWYGDNRV